jgi:hypothetical protein
MEADEKTCPFCAETIKAAAVVCKHCGRDLAQTPMPTDADPALMQAHGITYVEDRYVWRGNTFKRLEDAASYARINAGKATHDQPSHAAKKSSFGWGKLALLLLIGVPVITIGSIYVRNKAVGPQGWLKDDTEKLLRARMKDPDSMVIRQHYFVRGGPAGSPNTIAICGVVDGKNAFGSYSGGTRFVAYAMAGNDYYSGPQVLYMEDAKEQEEAKSVNMLSAFDKVYWNGHCVDQDHPAIDGR